MSIGIKMTDWNRSTATIMGKKGKQDKEDAEYVKKYPDAVIFARLIQFLKPYKKNVMILVACLLITSVTQLAYPIGMTVILQIIQPSGTAEGLSLTLDQLISRFSSDPYLQLLWVGVLLFLSMGLNYITKRTYHFNLQKLSQTIIADLRNALFVHIQGLSMQFYSEMPAGKLMSRLTNDVGTVQALISTEIIQAIGDLFMIASSIVLMFAMSWRISLIICLFAPLFGLIFYLFSRRSRKYWFQERRTIAELTGILQESISGSRTIKAFVTESDNIHEFSTVNRQNRKISLQAARVNAMLTPVTQLMIACGIGLVVFIGSQFVQAGLLSISVLLGYVILAQQFMNPLSNLGTLYNNAQHALAAGDRILGILDTKADIVDAPNAKILPPIMGNIEYRHVSFRYVPDVPVLSDINLKVTPNQRVALVGFTGAGKSTFISLLNRFYDLNEGQIFIDGYDIKQVTMKSLRSQMGIVLQDTFLFSGTVLDNIRFGRLTATDEEVIETAKQVGAHQFILRLPEGYRTNVMERGNLLS